MEHFYAPIHSEERGRLCGLGESASMHVNTVMLIGPVGTRGVKLSYSEQAVPTCTFWLEVEEPGKGGQLYTSYIPVEVTGKYAEDAAATLEPGDEVLLDGWLKYRSTVSPQTQEKAGRLVVRTWMVTKAQATAEAGSMR
jgi:single-stranded DNA-binding protein